MIMRVLALLLVVGGVLALAYGGFTYTKSTNTTKLGPVEFAVKDQQYIAIPVGVGVAAVLIGAGYRFWVPRR